MSLKHLIICILSATIFWLHFQSIISRNMNSRKKQRSLDLQVDWWPQSDIQSKNDLSIESKTDIQLDQHHLWMQHKLF